MSKEQIVEMILDRLNRDEAVLAEAFEKSKYDTGVRHCVVDDLLPRELAEKIYCAFPKTEGMRLMNSFREKKFTSKDFDRFDPLMKDITFAMQDQRVVEAVSRVTGIHEQIPDSGLYAGGLSALMEGHYLSPHIDNSHEANRQYYRTLNLLYYVTPDWKLENGGNLELWDGKVRKNATIVSRFNRLTIMETTPTSWHSVSPVTVDETRCCVSNYYFSPRSPTGRDYFNVTSFSAWPHQPMKRVWARVDNAFRQALRSFLPSGPGKKDLYQGVKP